MDKSQDTQRRIHDSIIAEINDLYREINMSNNTYKYTDLKIRKVEAKIENWENDGYIEKTYFEIVDDDGHIYLTLDSLG